MTSKKTTRRALLSSMLALLLCVSMLVGSTFAWFTDEVTSSNNIIKSGSLDVEMQHSTDKIEWKDASKGAIFDYKFWEPGYTQIKYVKVINNGNLAFQYQMNIIPEVLPAQGVANLADVIDVYMFDANAAVDRAAIAAATPVGTLSGLMGMTDGAVTGILLPAEGKGTTDYNVAVDTPRGEVTYCIVLKMQEEAGNEYQNLSVGEGFKVQVMANQYTWEEDSFDHMYDEQLPNAKLENADEHEGVQLQWGSFGQWSPTYPAEQKLEAVYVFTAPHDSQTVQNSKYKDWYCDFVVSLDQEVTMTGDVGDLFLGGNYGSFGWIGFENPEVVPANTEIPLLGSVTTNPWTYEMIASNVGTFTCGVARTFGSDMSKLAGATFTVKLQLTNPETNEVYDVETVKYTFPSTVSSDAELEDALTGDSENIVVNLTGDVTYDVGAWQNDAMGGNNTKTITINGNGHTITFNKTNSDWTNIVTNGAKLIINNATITDAGYDSTSGTWNGHDITFNCDVELNNVVSLSAIALEKNAVLNYVEITDDSTDDAYMLWICANGQTVELNSCLIDATGTDGNDRGIKIDEEYVGTPAKVTLKVNNTKFVTEKKAAILVKSAAGADITVNDIDIAGVAADTTNAVWVDSDAADYADLVTVTGATKIVES